MLTTDTLRQRCFMRLFVVYERPRDYPGEFIAREHFVMNDGRCFAAADLFARGTTVDAIRRRLPPGAYNLGRYRSDDPSIREVWV